MSTEIERLLRGPMRNERPSGIGTVRFIVTCPNGNSRAVLDLAKMTLHVAIGLSNSRIFDATTWAATLPSAFVENAPPHPTQQENDMIISLPIEDRIQRSEHFKCSVTSFMNSFLPELELKGWYWWDASIVDAYHIIVAVEVSEWPFPWQSLRWLFQGSGAHDLMPE